jgi:hypothetical protein
METYKKQKALNQRQRAFQIILKHDLHHVYGFHHISKKEWESNPKPFWFKYQEKNTGNKGYQSN